MRPGARERRSLRQRAARDEALAAHVLPPAAASRGTNGRLRDIDFAARGAAAGRRKPRKFAASNRDIGCLALNAAVIVALLGFLWWYVEHKEPVSAVSTTKYPDGPKKVKAREAALAAFVDADEQAKKGELETAIERYRMAIGYAGPALDAALKSKAQNNLGATLLRAGRLDEAEDAFLAATESDESNVAARVNLGRTRLGVGNAEGAAAALARAVEAAPWHANAQFLLGRSLTELRRHSEAADAYAAAAEADPSHVDALVSLGAALQETRGQEAKAVASFRRALRADPDAVPAARNLGTMLLTFSGLETVGVAAPGAADPDCTDGGSGTGVCIADSTSGDDLLRHAHDVELSKLRADRNPVVSCRGELRTVYDWDSAVAQAATHNPKAPLLVSAVLVGGADRRKRGESYGSAEAIPLPAIVGVGGVAASEAADGLTNVVHGATGEFRERVVTRLEVMDAHVAGSLQGPLLSQGKCNVLLLTHAYLTPLRGARQTLADAFGGSGGGSGGGKRGGAAGRTGTAAASALTQRPAVKLVQVDTAVSIVQQRDTNFYHFTFECLSRLAFVLDELHDDADGDIALLVPDATGGSFIGEALQMLGVSGVQSVGENRDGSLKGHSLSAGDAAAVENLRRTQRRVIHIEPNTVVHASRLITVDWRPTDLSPHQQFLPPRAALRRLRTAFADSGFAAPQDLVVYISRSDGPRGHAGRRAVRNEEAVLTSLRSAIGEANAAGEALELKVFYGSESTLAAARRVFSRARVVIGVHGAGLSNVIFCREGTALVEVTMPEPWYAFYRHAAAALGLDYWAVQDAPPNSFDSPITLPPQRLPAIVGAILGGKS